MRSKGIRYSADNVIKLIADHYSYSTSFVYESIRKKCRNIDVTSDEVIQKTENIRRASLPSDKIALDFSSNKIFIEEGENKSFWSSLYFSKNSNTRRLIDLVHMLNLLYIAISIPLIICFDITMQSYTIVFEIVSLSISACIIFINIRTPVIHRGGTTLSFKSVLIYYYHNGLVLDLVALWPMNLIFGISDLVEPVWLFPPIRIIRMIAAWKIMHIFGKFELFFKNYTVTMNILKAILFLCILWHWASCLWFFTSLYINSEQDFTWIEYNELDTSPLYKQVLFCYYTIMNVVSTVGYGDMFPMTDVERIFIILLINSGDALFAVAFGLIAGITLQASNNKSTDVFFKKMYSIKELITQNGGDQTHKLKVEQFFAYSWHLHKSTNMVSIKNLSTQLPYRLSKEVVYYSTKHLLEPMFGSFGSENLIRNVSTALEQCIYLPGDFIILKDDIGDEMYFIAEGRVYILAADKRTVINTLGQGSYFGEMAIFLESNIRTAFVQAETFCSILILKKTDLDNIKINYPSVAKDITKEAQKRASETREIMEANKEDMWQELEDIEEEKRDLERMYGTPLGMRVNSFSPSLFKEKSRRSSVDILRTPRNDESIAGSPLRVPRVKRRTSQFFKSINLQSNNKDEQEEQRNWASSNNVNSKVEDFKEKMKNEHKLLKVQDSLRMQKLNSFGTEKQCKLLSFQF